MYIYHNETCQLSELVTMKKMSVFISEYTGISVTKAREILRKYKENFNNFPAGYTFYTDEKAVTIMYHWNCPIKEKWSIKKIA